MVQILTFLFIINMLYGERGEVVNTSGCGSDIRGFNSRRSPHFLFPGLLFFIAIISVSIRQEFRTLMYNLYIFIYILFFNLKVRQLCQKKLLRSTLLAVFKYLKV